MTTAPTPQDSQPRGQTDERADEGATDTPRPMRGIAIGLLMVTPLWAALAGLIYLIVRWLR